jgi:hypothetical protein
MTRRMLTVIASVALLLSLVPAAHAATGAKLTINRHTTALAAAKSAAIQYWHRQPCAGRIAIRYALAPSGPVDTGGLRVRSLFAWTSAETTSVPSQYADCTVTLNSRLWSPATEARYFPVFCALMVHEYGHLVGHPDERGDSPRSITYPLITSRNEFVGPCVSRYALFPHLEFTN